jgi:DNA-binding beta-propeller fold protein YncE
MQRRVFPGGAAARAAGLIVLALLGCQQESIKVTTYHLERSGEIAFVCYCTTDAGTPQASVMETCDPEAETRDCSPYAFVLQTNRDEIGIVNLRSEALVDSDVRVPFNTFNHTGRGPTDLAVTPDGKRLLVTHAGDPFIAVFRTDEMLGEFLADFDTIPLPGPSSSIAVSDVSGMAYVALPEESAIAVIDLADLEADPLILELPGPAVLPDEDVEEVAETVEPAGEAAEEAAAEDAAEEDGAEEDAAEEDAAEDAPAEEAAADDGAPDAPLDAETDEIDIDGEEPFYPWQIATRETETGSLVIVSGSGSGGVTIFDAARITEGLEASFVTRLLEDTSISKVAFTPTGDFLYAVDRDEGTIHVVEMASGQEIDTTGGNPLVPRGAIKLGGMATDILIREVDYGEEVDPYTLRGVFGFATSTDGRLSVIDIVDLNCTGDCPSHVQRNVNDVDASYPSWSAQPTILKDGTQVQYISFPDTYPRPDRFDATLPPEGTFMYGVSFYPYDPWETGHDGTVPDIRRALTQQWRIAYEGVLPYSGGIGGNVEEGGRFTDSGLPLCVVGVRAGDTLVIEDPPEPLGGEDCTAFVEGANEDGELEYLILEARQNELLLAPPAGRAYGVPTETCFPFAVKYHVRVVDEWVVSGGSTGYLNDWGVDADGMCIDLEPPCTTWTQLEDCTLIHGRAKEDAFFVNPYIKFRLNSLRDDHGNRKPPTPGSEYVYQAVGGFLPLGMSIARLPTALAYLPWNDSLYVSDAATEGLIEVALDGFKATNSFY